jgi:hypothetical protein
MFLQPVDIPERCFLQEVLFWVAFQRLPVASYTIDGKEFRDSDEVGGYAVELPEGDWLDDDECARAKIPPDPRFAQLMGQTTTLSVEYYDKFLAGNDLDDAMRTRLEGERRDAVEFQRAYEAWEPHYAQAIEYPASRIFVVLKSGRLRAKGRLLPDIDADAAIKILSADDRDIYDLPIVEIPPSFWSLRGIEFEESAARNDHDRYCHIHCRTDEVLVVFPGESREPVFGVEKIGGSFLISEAAAKTRHNEDRRRGRPSYPWEAFHLEVAALLQSGELPAKKEAGIQHFQEWFHRGLKMKPSRAAIGEKLKPYYDRFVRPADKKSQNH